MNVVRTLLYDYPVNIPQLPGPVVTGSRHTKQILRHWQGDPSTLAESAQSLEAYEGGGSGRTTRRLADGAHAQARLSGPPPR